MSAPFVILALLMLGGAALVIALPLRRAARVHGTDADAALSWRWPTIWLVTGLAAMAAGTYGVVGEPAALLIAQVGAGLPPSEQDVATAAPAQQREEGPSNQPPEAGAGTGIGQAQIEAMVQRLAQRLQTQPQDPAGWRMLAKSYETLGRFDDAVRAYQQLFSLQAPDPDLLTDYAVTLGMSRGQTLAGEPEAVINQALKIDPRHVQALALSGSAAFEQGDYPRAVSQWQKLLAIVPKDAPMRASIERNVEKAKGLGG